MPVIAAALEEAGDEGTVIIDCPPGSACPVMEAAREAGYCVLVTEPTAFGLHDLRLVVELMRVMGKPCGVVVNKAGAEYAPLEEYPAKKSFSGILRSFDDGIITLDDNGSEYKIPQSSVSRAKTVFEF